MVEKEKAAKKLLLDEIRKEGGNFVTQRIIDRLKIFHFPTLENRLLVRVVEEVNREMARKERF